MWAAAWHHEPLGIQVEVMRAGFQEKKLEDSQRPVGRLRSGHGLRGALASRGEGTQAWDAAQAFVYACVSVWGARSNTTTNQPLISNDPPKQEQGERIAQLQIEDEVDCGHAQLGRTHQRHQDTTRPA